VDEQDDRTRLSLTLRPDDSSPSWLYWIAPT
jgi:hypothetical protein